ncbi:MAG TPA: hypothetical protein VF786_10160, partial [Terriglobales bacterium]
LAAVEALTRGLVNKFLHQPMQALKQAAREGDSARLDAVCAEWAVSAAINEPAPEKEQSKQPEPAQENERKVEARG